MKSRILFFAGLAFLLLATVGCRKLECHGYNQAPEGALGIDWNDYNTVQSLFDNFNGLNYTRYLGSAPYPNGHFEGDTIMVKGWLVLNRETPRVLFLSDNAADTIIYRDRNKVLPIRIPDQLYDQSPEIWEQLWQNVSRKYCRITGTLHLEYCDYMDPVCCPVSPEVIIHSINDVLYEQ